MSHFEWEDVDVNAGNLVFGKISNIDVDNLKADVEGVGTNIPIHYHCEEDAIEDTGKSFDVDYPDEQDERGATAFSGEDDVLVMFRRVNNKDPIIIGFPGEAKVCANRFILFSFSEDSPTSSNSRCMVWDIINNTYAQIPGIIFPVAYSEITEWIGTKTYPFQKNVFRIDTDDLPSQDDIDGIISQISDAEENPLPCETGSAWVTDLTCYKEKYLDWEAISGELLESNCTIRNRQEFYVVSCSGIWINEYYVIHEKWITQFNDLYEHSTQPDSNMRNMRLEPVNFSGISSFYRTSVYREGYHHNIDNVTHGGGGLCLIDDGGTFDLRVAGNKYIFNYYTPIGYIGTLETIDDNHEGQFEMITKSSDYVVAQAYIYQCVPSGEDRKYIIGAQADRIEDATGLYIDPTSFDNNLDLVNALKETIEGYYAFKGYASDAYVYLMNYSAILY